MCFVFPTLNHISTTTKNSFKIQYIQGKLRWIRCVFLFSVHPSLLTPLTLHLRVYLLLEPMNVGGYSSLQSWSVIGYHVGYREGSIHVLSTEEWYIVGPWIILFCSASFHYKVDDAPLEFNSCLYLLVYVNWFHYTVHCFITVLRLLTTLSEDLVY